MSSCRFFAPALALASLLAVAAPLAAQTWNGNGPNDNWSANANWVGGVAPVGNANTSVTFAGTARLTPQQNLSSSLPLNALTFTGSAGAFVLGGGGFDFRNASGGIAPSITQNSASAITLNGKPNQLTNTLELRAGGNGTLTLAGTFSGTGAILFQGGAAAGITQRVVMGGTGSSDFSGGIVLGSGTQVSPADLAASSDNAFGSGQIILATGNVFRAATSATRRFANTVDIVAPGNVLGNVLTFGAGGTLIFEGAFGFGGATKTVQLEVGLLRLDGPVSGSGTTIFTGSGQLQLSHADTSGLTGFISIANTGGLRLDIPGLPQTGLTLNGPLIVPAGNIAFGALGGGANLNLATGLTLGRNGLGLVYSGSLTVGSTLSKTGSSTQILQGGTHTVGALSLASGQLDLNGGSLATTNTAALGLSVANSTLRVLNGAQLDTRSTSLSALTFGEVQLSGAASRWQAGALLSVGRSDPTGTSSLTVDAGTLNVNGTLAIGADPAGNGTLTAGNGATLTSSIGVVGQQTGSTGTVTLQTGAQWTTGALGLGGASGSVNGGTATLNVAAGGLLTVIDNLTFWTGTAALNVNGGSASAARLSTPTAGALVTLTDPSGGSALTVGAGGADSDINLRLAGTGTLRKVGAGKLTLRNENSTGGRVRLEGGLLEQGAPLAFSRVVIECLLEDAIVLNGNDLPVFGGLAGSGSLNLTDITLTVGNAGTNEVYSGVLSGNGSLIKVGAGRLTLSGANTLTGGVRVEAGSLELAAFNTLPSNLPISLLGSGRLELRPSVVALSGIGSVPNANQTGWFAGGTVLPSPQGSTPVTWNVNLPTGVTQTYAGATADGGRGRLSLVKSGPGTLRLGSETVAHTGLTTVQQGVLELDGAFALPGVSTLPGGVRINAGARLRLAAGPGLPGRYLAGLVPAQDNYKALASLQNLFLSNAPTLFGSSLSAGPTFDFGNQNQSLFPPPFQGNLSSLQACWVGRFRAATAGLHTFTLSSDDGSVLYVDGQLVVDNAFYQAPTTRTGSVALTPGEHEIVLAYFQGGGGYEFSVRVQEPGASVSVPLPQDRLSYVTRARVGGLSGGGTVELQGGALDLAEDGYGVFSGAITDTGGGSLTKSGEGTTVLRGPNAATGGLRLQGGTLGLAHGSVGSGPIVVSGPAALFPDGAALTLANAITLEASGALFVVDDPASGPRPLTVSGALTGSGAFFQQSGDTTTLTDASAFSGLLEVDAGVLALTGPCAASSVYLTGGTLQLNGGLTQASAIVTVLAGARLAGSGEVAGSVWNYGAIEAAGATLSFTNAVTNYGVLRAKAGGVLEFGASSSLVNYGVIDVISGILIPPGNFENYGLLLDASMVRVKSCSRVGTTVTLTIDSHDGHSYRLQRSTSLSGGTFVDVGPAQPGATGTTLTFTDANASGGSGFYRVAVD
ncbi:MAG: autotransporter-associated beta strand repeat-containing protein [Verrucomicrobia bacterium]|nr:autotransporter-associated beta strand repeat-containing protein [Verrucomicrobiota bacterium]